MIVSFLFTPEQIRTFKPELVSVKNESLVSELQEALSDAEHKPEIIPGEEGIVEVTCVIHTFLLLELLSKLPDFVLENGFPGCAPP